MDASDKELIKRFKESRRKHPLSSGDNISIMEALDKERSILSDIKKRADYVVDTSNLKPFQLKEQLSRIFEQNNETNRGLIINVVSFGFKHGTPLDSDLVFDVRFLPNPFYIEKLKHKTGLDEEVCQYVYDNDIAKEFQKKLDDLILFLLPHYIKEGKTSLMIAIGCTGGKHRSVAIAETLVRTLKNNGYYVVVNHHDIQK
ncbi:Nucleotide-binding protein [bioreactor metagenome]|uniref:Nucleotide-binding protein n=1 Tax=bioreactor metagenome TaxID=1076179 RepID=A0A645F5V7_9ZZZZ